jgi:two-component system, NtrC family, response regulator AtoC
MSASILVVDDDADALEAIEGTLSDAGYSVKACASGYDALTELARADFDAVVTDLRMPGMDGLRVCDKIAGNHPTLPVILMTAYGDLDAALAAMHAGAFDFINKPFQEEELFLSLERALRYRHSIPEVRRIRIMEPSERMASELVGTSAVMQSLLRTILDIGPTACTVLIQGETGTGKELVARAIHAESARQRGPLVPVNCAAIAEELLESELFGHVQGAFTGAGSARAGLMVAAAGGTLFLDEVGSMPLGLQPKLLRALQERKVRPVGGSEERPFDARVIAATNVDLRRAVELGRFRADLYYRLEGVTVSVPPLRDRGEDVIELAQHFLDKLHGRGAFEMTEAAVARLRAYPWPGNVRELENCMQAAAVSAKNGRIGPEALPPRVQAYAGPRRRSPEVASLTLDAVEREHILAVIHATGWNKARAASVLGIDRTTLYRKLKTYGLERG